jgi:DNA-binding LacI/PurR family transcriptional regulator
MEPGDGDPPRSTGAAARPTIKDVARAAGVSHMTVSRVINGRPAVAAATRSRVEQAIRSLDYAPNVLARGLVRQTSAVIGLLVSDIRNPFIGEVADAVHRVADEAGYVVNMGVTNYDVEREIQALKSLVARRVAGLIFTRPNRAASDERIVALAAQGVPIVTIGRELAHPAISMVSTNVYDGAYQATRHLLDLGHRRFGFITGSPRVGIGQPKVQGCRAALGERSLTLEPEFIVESDLSVRNGYRAMQFLLRRSRPPTAVLAITDAVAIGAMGAAAAEGRCIPGDISIVGFNDIPYAASVHPPLTTVQEPMYALGELAAHVLLDTIRHGPSVKPVRTVLNCALVIRGSTGRAPGTADRSVVPLTASARA